MSRPTFVAKSMCLFFHDGKVLLYEGQSKTGDKFLRPLGGHIEMGEYAIDAARREIKEELRTAPTDVTLLTIRENIFHYDGKLTHEYIFLFRASLVDTTFYEKLHIPFYEGEVVGAATWHDIASLRQSSIPVVPDGVVEACEKVLALT